MGDSDPLDPGAESALLDYAKWLVDRQADRLNSVEGRAVAVVGWAATQVAITLGVLTLVPNIADLWSRSAGIVAILFATLGLTIAVGYAVLGALQVQTIPAPETDLSTQRADIKALSTPDRQRDTLDALIAGLLDSSGDTKAVVPALKEAVDSRASSLRCATMALAGAVLLDVVGGLLLAYAATR